MATTKKTAAKTTDVFDFAAISPDMFKDSFSKLNDGVTDMMELQKATFDAFMTSATTFAKAAEKAATDQTAFVKDSYDETVATAKAATSSKSIQDAMEVQQDYLRDTFEKSMKQFNKSAELWADAVKEASQPITDQYGAMVEKVQAYRP